MELEQSVDAEDADLTLLLEAPPEEWDFVERLGREVGLAEVIPAPEEAPDPIVSGSTLEAVPLPSWLMRGLMRVLRRDVHHAGGLTGRGCATRAACTRPTRRSRYRRSRPASAGARPRPIGRPPTEDQDDIRHH
jgi:hypothetical protein